MSALFRGIIKTEHPIDGAYRYKDVFSVGKNFIELDKTFYRFPTKIHEELHKGENDKKEYDKYLDERNTSDYIRELVSLLSIVCNEQINSTYDNSHIFDCCLIQSFTPCVSAIPIVPEIIYQDYRAIDSKFSIEKGADIFFDKYYSLPENILKQFRMTIALYYNSDLVYPISPSMAFVSLISSIESMTEIETKIKKEKPKICETCKQPIYRISQKFKDFITKYYPGLDNNYLNKIYTCRSKIVHCGQLLYQDYGNSEFDIEFAHDYKQLRKIVRVCIYNWLSNFDMNNY